VPHSGWCPAGRRAEDGAIDSRYQLTETESHAYGSRTKRNVEDSNATLIVNLSELDGGTLKTLQIAERLGKPVRVVQLDNGPSSGMLADLREWLIAAGVEVLNVAGPRESKRPGIYQATRTLLEQLF